MFLDRAYYHRDTGAPFRPLGHLQTRNVGEGLEKTVREMVKYVRRRKLFREDDVLPKDESHSHVAQPDLEQSADSGQAPPAGPEYRVGLSPLSPKPLSFDKPLCAPLDGFTQRAATRAGGLDVGGRETLFRYILRPPVAQDRIVNGPHGVVRIVLKRAFSDATKAIDVDPLSLLCRLSASVPPPRYPIVKYAGVPASNGTVRVRLAGRVQ